MANIFLNLPLPVGTGPGAAVDTSAMGKDKTIIVDGLFTDSTISIEVSTNGGASFEAIWLFSDSGKQVIPVTADFMRTFVRGRGVTSANVDVGANDDGALFANLPISGTGIGAGAPVDVSAFGGFTTFIASGAFPRSTISIEVSEDGVSYFPCGMSFSGQGGIQSKVVTANFMRTFVRGESAAGTLVSIGATNDSAPVIDLGEVVEQSLYKGNTTSTSGASFVDAMTGDSISVLENGNYYGLFECTCENQAASGALEIGISVNSTTVVVANSERQTRGPANIRRSTITSVQLGALNAGDLVRALFRKASGVGAVALNRRNLTIFKVR